MQRAEDVISLCERSVRCPRCRKYNAVCYLNLEIRVYYCLSRIRSSRCHIPPKVVCTFLSIAGWVYGEHGRDCYTYTAPEGSKICWTIAHFYVVSESELTVEGCCWCHGVQRPTTRRTKDCLYQRCCASGHHSRCYDTRVNARLYCDCEAYCCWWRRNTVAKSACYWYWEHTNSKITWNCFDIDALSCRIKNSIRGGTCAGTSSAQVASCAITTCYRISVFKFRNRYHGCCACIDIVVWWNDWRYYFGAVAWGWQYKCPRAWNLGDWGIAYQAACECD